MQDDSKELVPVFTVVPLSQELLLGDVGDDDDDDDDDELLVLAVPGRAQAIRSTLPKANVARSNASVRKCFLAIIRKTSHYDIV
jgi:hypothetical protein